MKAAKKDPARITSEWNAMHSLIAGVRVHEVKNVVMENLCLTEIFRQDWPIAETPIRHVLHVLLQPGARTATWTMHERQHDHIFVTAGLVKAVLCDGREGSPTMGKINAFILSPLRPTLLAFPPGIWHVFVNLLENEASSLLTLTDIPYCYDNPDSWRLPLDTPEIPYRFDH
jgi:dTDP-4-dehydrorhamnose 3,5-epimerase